MLETAGAPNGLARFVPRLSAEWHLHTRQHWRTVEGTLCYVDISGFTALSEKLARRGRIGAEELTDVLDHVFGNMLSVAYQRGGNLLKFGGDALLLVFRGEDHPIQACSAAVEMNAVLREAREYRTSAGRLRLKMSVGLHSGTVHLFRVGGSHQELVLTGPAATRTTEMEETATAGEILISPQTRAALPPGSATRAKGAGHLLTWRKPRIDRRPWIPRVDVAPEILADSMPVALRSHLAHDRVEAEHHVATVGFVRFEGIDGLMNTDGPDAAAAALDQLVTTVQEAVDQEGVTFLASDIDADGGKIIIVAGVPSVREDDEGRVLRAARRIVDRAGALTVRIGVNRGHVFVGEIGAEHRATYTIMGDTVNLAARLMASASPGEVYASPSALDRSHSVFAATALEPFHVKGKARPVQAYAVGSEIGSRPVDRRHELPFVGRRSELAILRARVEALPSGSGGAVTVVGERGAGKSRLVEELLLGLDGIDCLETRAEPYGIATPYRPLRDPIRRLLEIEPGDPAVMARRLRRSFERLLPDRLPLLPLIADTTMIDVPSTPEADRIEPRFRQDRTADLLIELIAAIHHGPLLIGVEDGHHMDEASAHVMRRVSAAATERPWLVITTRRDEEGGFHPEGDDVALGPLSHEEARELVLAATEAAPLRPHDVQVIIDRAGGLPLFLEEIVGAVRRSGGVDDLPDSLDAVVSAQIDALPPLSRRLLRFSSVLGRSFRIAILDELLDVEAVRIDTATRRDLAGFVEPAEAGRLRFRHAVIRDVAYESLSFRRRRELHLRAGEAVERAARGDGAEQADVLALHFSLAEDHRRAWHYSLIAGDSARDTYANADAATHYRRALHSARRLGEVPEEQQADVWTSLGDVCERAGRYEDSFEAYRRATRLMGDDPYRRADLMVKRAGVRRYAGAYPAALRETATGLRLVALDLTDDGARARARLTAERSAIRKCQERTAEALRLAEEAEADARTANDLTTLAITFDLIDWAHRMMGEAEQVVHVAEALAIFERLGDLGGVALVSNNMGAEAYYQGRWDDALDAYRRSRYAELQRGNDVNAAIPAANTAELLINQGRFDEAEPLLHDAIRVLRASGHKEAGFAESELARLHVLRGEHAVAERLLAEIRDRGRANDEPRDVVDATIVLAESKLRQGDPETGLALLDEIESDEGDLAEVFDPVVSRLRGQSLAALGRRDDAFAEIEHGMEVARGQGLLYEEALLRDARVTIAEALGVEPDPADVAEANRLFDELGVRRRAGARGLEPAGG